MKSFSKITLGHIINTARRRKGLSQKELAAEVSKLAGRSFDYVTLAQVENDRLEIQQPNYDWLVLCLSELLALDTRYLGEIRKQTEATQLDLSGGIFPRYFKPR